MKPELSNVGDIMAEVWRLESQLGKERSKPILHLKWAIKKMRLLQQEATTKAPAAAPARPAQPRPVPAPSPALLLPSTGSTAKPTANPSRAQLLQILLLVNPTAAHEVHEVRDDWNDSQVKLEVERACYQNRVRFPGMRTDQELSEEFWRPAGSRGSRAGALQENIDHLLRTGKKKW